MSDETNETSEQQQPVEEQAAETAGPVADGAPSSSQAAGEDAPSAPPADDAPTADAEEQAAEEAPAPEVEAEREEPKKEEKKDVIPGAELEPIAIEPEAPELSAEERARLEAEEEEKARREAELAAAESDSTVADRAPAKMESGSRFLATGKRKSSIARVTLLPGDGKFSINGRELAEFFPRPLHQTMVKQPLTVSGYEGNVDVRVRVHGGGISGQAGAVRHGIARALTEIDAELRGDLKRRGFLTRDARVKERRKAGFKKARKKPQFSKR
ncbi:MAG TPA: 30S ribosomal protein S9 [Solirubrobacterales bacterium]|nr:30S ribosomal protein S9 [Solirubrobacterales bacterium]